ncbi:MAG: Flp family type IVb pilin [Armatimonadota bacterium]
MGVHGPLAALWRDEAGMTATEYCLLLAVVSLSAVLAFGNFSTELQTVANRTSDELVRAFGSGCGSR